MSKVRAYYRAGAALFPAILDAEPKQIAAATEMASLAPYHSDYDALGEAHGVLEAHGDPLRLFYHYLWLAKPQWGGSEAIMRALCVQGAPALPTLSEPVCQAYVTVQLGQHTFEDFSDAAETLASAGPGRFITSRARALYSGQRREEALALLERTDTWRNWQLIDRLSGLDTFTGKGERQPRDETFLTRSLERWMVRDPRNPRIATAAARVRARAGDLEGAVTRRSTRRSIMGAR